MDRMAEMEIFVAVVDSGGFTEAANKLRLSKSSVSKHIASLESRLGVTLLKSYNKKRKRYRNWYQLLPKMH